MTSKTNREAENKKFQDAITDNKDYIKHLVHYIHLYQGLKKTREDSITELESCIREMEDNILEQKYFIKLDPAKITFRKALIKGMEESIEIKAGVLERDRESLQGISDKLKEYRDAKEVRQAKFDEYLEGIYALYGETVEFEVVPYPRVEKSPEDERLYNSVCS